MLVDLSPGQVLYEPGDPIDWVYFPLSGQVSLLVVSVDGLDTEGAAVGNEGIVGLQGAVAGGSSFTRQQVLLRGAALRIAREHFVSAVEFSSTLRRAIAAHSDSFAAQLLQSAFCLGSHNAQARLSRWLLTAYDNVGDSWLELTQDTIAQALGFTRPTITLTLNSAGAAGILRIERGRLVLLDRAKLVSLACCCYSIIRSNFDRDSRAPARN